MKATGDLGALVPPQRETLQERVYRELRVALMRGQFTPGRALTIRALAAALRTSSMPVREALRQLVTEGALVMLPNRSFGVPRLSSESFRDLLRVRVELEGYAAAEAASRITDAVVNRLDEINRAMRAAAEIGDRIRYMSCNQEFHFTIYKMAGSKVLMPLIEALWLQYGPYIACVFSEGSAPIVNLDRHEGLADALRRRNPVDARAMLAADITEPAELILQVADAGIQRTRPVAYREGDRGEKVVAPTS